MRIVIAGLVGGIAMFVWTSVAHVALPLGQIGFSQIPNEKAVVSAMQNSIGSHSGLYFFPWTDMKSSDAMAQVEAKMKVHPSGLLVYHPPGAGGMTAQMLVIEFVKEVIVSLIAAFLLAQTVFAAEFHRQFNLLNVDIRVGQDARHIVKGRQTDLCFCTDEQ